MRDALNAKMTAFRHLQLHICPLRHPNHVYLPSRSIWLCNLMLLIPPTFFRIQTFSIWVNFTVRILPKPHYSFFSQGSSLLNARCDDNGKMCNIISQNFETQCDPQENRNRIWLKTGPVTLAFDIWDSRIWQPDLATHMAPNCQSLHDNGKVVLSASQAYV